MEAPRLATCSYGDLMTVSTVVNIGIYDETPSWSYLGLPLNQEASAVADQTALRSVTSASCQLHRQRYHQG